MLSLFTLFELGKIKKYFATRKSAKVITSLLFLITLIFVALGIYFFFIAAFRYINFGLEDELRLPITLFLYEIFLIIVASIVIFSSIITGIFNLFRGSSDGWLMSSPSYTFFPKFTLIKNSITSAWPLLVIFLPGILAFNYVYHLSFISLILILVSTVLLLVLLTTLSLSGTLFIGFCCELFAKKTKLISFNFKGFVTTLFIISIIFVTLLWRVVRNIDLVQLFKAEDTEHVVSLLDISQYFYFLPTHYLAREIVSLQSKDLRSAFSHLIILAILTIVFLFVWKYVSKLHYPLWQKFQEGTGSDENHKKSFFKNYFTFTFTGGKTVTLFKKEALVSGRNLKGLLWFSFLFFIWLAQIGSHSIVSRNISRYSPDISAQLVLLETLEFLIALYFICAFTLRFVFPAFSVEKKVRWVLDSAPLNVTKIFYSKYLFYVAFFTILGLLMNYTSMMILSVPLYHAWYTLALFITSILFVVTLGLSLGALFPSSETDDPEVISTSLSGLSFTLLSLLYGALSSWVLHGLLKEGGATIFIVFILGSLTVASVLLINTPKLIAKRGL